MATVSPWIPKAATTSPARKTISSSSALSSSSELAGTHFSETCSCLNTTTPMVCGSTAREQTFLCVATSDLTGPEFVNIYSVNLQTGVLTATASSPLPGFTSVPLFYVDPTGSFDYGFGTDENTAIAYTVDPQTGYFLETANSPFTIPQIAGSLTFSIPPSQQGISGPSASLSATSLSFGSIQTGSSSIPQTVTLTSNGGEALDVNSISLTGADPSQFTESDTCQAPSVLQPTKFCSINITFTPSASGTGSQQATLSITYNALAARNP